MARQDWSDIYDLVSAKESRGWKIGMSWITQSSWACVPFSSEKDLEGQRTKSCKAKEENVFHWLCHILEAFYKILSFFWIVSEQWEMNDVVVFVCFLCTYLIPEEPWLNFIMWNLCNAYIRSRLLFLTNYKPRPEKKYKWLQVREETPESTVLTMMDPFCASDPKGIFAMRLVLWNVIAHKIQSNLKHAPSITSQRLHDKNS